MSNFLRTESEKILMEALKSSDNSSGRDILRDDDDSWYKIPYQITFGKKFNTVKEDILFRTQNLIGIDGDNIGINNPESVSSARVSEVFGLDGDINTLTMLDKAYYQDTRVGANDALNCLWQFNRDDDILHDVSVVSTSSGTKIGLSRVYSNTTQTNQQIAYFTFGVPYYSSILHFHKNAFDEKLITINQQGYDSDEGGKKLGELFGEGLVLLIALPILPFKLFYELAKHNANNYKINRFYELRGRMQLYYKYVDSMLAHWLVASGLYGNDLSIVGLSKKLTADPNCLPLALRLTGASIWEIVSRKAVNAGVYIYDKHKRAKIIEESLYGNNATPLRYKAEKESRVKFSDDELESRMNSVANNTLFNSAEQSVVNSNSVTDKNIAYEREVVSSEMQVYDNRLNKLGFTHKTETLAYEDDHGSWDTVFGKSALGATQFIGFRVDKSTDASESFSNSTSPSAFAENFNSKVKEIASKSIDTGIKGASSRDTWIDSAIEDVKSIGMGILDGLKAIDFIGLTDLANAVMTGAFVDIPEQYSGSDFNKSHSLSFQLRSPYGDKVSIYQSIIVPLFCILAGALPRAGGANSYVQPFLCRVYCKGMFAIPMGIIDSISIKRGDSEFGWTYDTIPTCVDVNISIKDMSPIMYMMINDAAFSDILGSDSAFNEYLLTLSGVGLFDRISQIQKVVRGMVYTAHTVRDRYFNPMYWSHSISQYSPIQFVASFIPRAGVNNN